MAATAGTGTRPFNFLQPRVDVTSQGNNAYKVVISLANSVGAVGGVAVSAGTGNVTSSSFSGNDIVVNLSGVTNKQATTITVTDVNAGEFKGDLSIPLT